MSCQHKENEDCLICVACGQCREDLDDSDTCTDCSGICENESRAIDDCRFGGPSAV